MHAAKTLLFVFLTFCLHGISHAEAKYIGVESCASSSCHGAKGARDNKNVAQNEYTTWFRFDPHSRSAQTLHSQRAINITQTLGQAKPWKNENCLGCHSASIPKELASPSYSDADGIGCESCHGPAEKWLNTHHRGDNGQQPTAIWQPHQEAKLCLGCHSPSKAKSLDHPVFAAGHPPLSFELVTFSQLQPSHVVSDADYEQRKAALSDIERWLAGQVTAASIYLERLEDHIANNQQFAPDGALFTCHSCHQSADRPQAVSSPNPGILQPDTSAIQMLAIAAAASNWVQTEAFDSAISNWLAAAGESKTSFADATATLWQLIKQLDGNKRLKQQLRSDDGLANLSAELHKQVAAGKFKYWTNAEQAYYLLGITDPRANRQLLLQSLSSPNSFSAELFQAEFADLLR